jgi:hypothetical protein
LEAAYPHRRLRWDKELVAVLARSFTNHASRLPTREVPDDIVRDMAKSNPNTRTIVHELGRDLSVSAAKANRILNWSSRPDEECIRASAQSLWICFALVESGLVAIWSAFRIEPD